jgi:hypothetical protein
MGVLLVALPLYVRVSGDHPTASCGNALVMDLGRWPSGAADDVDVAGCGRAGSLADMRVHRDIDLHVPWTDCVGEQWPAELSW